MSASFVYIVISIAAIAAVALLVFLVSGKKKDNKNRLTPLAGFAFSFVMGGIIFGDNRLIGYGLMSVGVVLAVIDIIIRMKQQ